MDINICERPGYISREISELVIIIKQGESFLDVYCDKLLKEGISKVNLCAQLYEAKTYFNMELKKEFPTINDRAYVYDKFANYAHMTSEIVAMIDNKLKKLQSN